MTYSYVGQLRIGNKMLQHSVIQISKKSVGKIDDLSCVGDGCIKYSKQLDALGRTGIWFSVPMLPEYKVLPVYVFKISMLCIMSTSVL